ncbi:MAG: TIGR02281 family clan AA aspartic protease [Magnetococcales bacterium]|nr:TIGR02281 family clan AA aspartic protease [Magnetococcales bacterium]
MIRFIVFFLGGLGVAAVLHERFLGSVSVSLDTERMGYAAGSAFLLAWLLTSVNWHGLPNLVKSMGIWIGLLMILVLVYGVRHEWAELYQRFLAILIPQRGFSQDSGSWNVFKSADGHFYVEIMLNRTPIRMLVDTGASDMILTRSDARKIGLSPERLEYTRHYQTANGETRGAPVLLDEVRLGSLILHRMPASVLTGEAHESLLGMAFFKRLDSYEVKQDRLTFRWTVKTPP